MWLIYFVLGAALGSFAGALTYRWPREESIVNGRSHCPHCKKTIHFYDNIPLISYLLLRAKCRTCKVPISSRYFLIELGLALLFTTFYFYNLATPINLALVFITYSILVIDWEHQYIPDTLIFSGICLVLINLFANNLELYIFLMSGLSAGLFLLLINLGTLGRGMGLGDVKLAFFIGMFLGYPFTVTWMFLSFVIGSIIGIMLVLFRLKKFRQRVAFGPFLVASFYVTLLFGKALTPIIFPIL